MSLEEGYRNAEVIEGVGHAVSEAANDEERNCKKEGQIMLLPCECHSCGHKETARDAEETAAYCPCVKPELKNSLSRTLDVHRRDSCHESEAEAAEDVPQKDEEKLADFILVYESCCTGIELQLISDNSKKAEGEEHRSDKGAVNLRLDT